MFCTTKGKGSKKLYGAYRQKKGSNKCFSQLHVCLHNARIVNCYSVLTVTSSAFVFFLVYSNCRRCRVDTRPY